MESPEVDIRARFINAFWKQKSPNAESGLTGLLICPYGHNGSVFQSFDQLLDHTKAEHPEEILLNDEQTRFNIGEAVARSRQAKEFSNPVEGGGSVPDLSSLSLEPKQKGPLSGKKRRQDTNVRARQKQKPSSSGVLYGISRPSHHTDVVESQQHNPRYPGLLLQPKSRPITQEQLAAEVKPIYASLGMVKSKSLLGPTHNSQHPSASPALPRLVVKNTSQVAHQLGANHQQLLPGASEPKSSIPLRTSRSIPGKLAGTLEINAFGDTGAKYNFMDEQYAISQADFAVDRTQVEKVALGNGETVMTTGTVSTTFQFPGEKEIYSQLFYLLPTCPHKVILGNRFLKMTKTFTNNLNRLRRVVTRTVSRMKAHDFFYIGGSGPAFKGLVNGHLQYALADTGAKLLLMDEDYAQKLGLVIETSLQHRTRVQFADRTTAMTSGMTYGVSWQYGDNEGESHMLDFHILKNIPANVILSEDFLLGDETNAFADYACYMHDEEEDDDDASCFMIDIDYSYGNPAVDTREYRDNLETVRYGEEEDWIDSLSGDEKRGAQAAVQLRRAQWDPTQPMTGANAMNVVPPQFRQASSHPKTVRKRLKFRLWTRKKTV